MQTRTEYAYGIRQGSRNLAKQELLCSLGIRGSTLPAPGYAAAQTIAL